MKKLNPSIRTQLLLWLVTPILVLLIGSAWVTYAVAIGLTTEAYDKALLDSVYSVAACVQVRHNKVVVDLPPPALAILLESMKDHVYYQVLDNGGRLLAGDSFISSPERSPTFREGSRMDAKSADYRYSEINHEEVRIASMYFPVHDKPGESVLIQVGETMHGREQIANQILIGVIFMQLLMVSSCVLAVWFGVARGLQPLGKVRDAVATRTPSDLRTIAGVDVPKEVRPLVQAINDLLGRLREDIEAQRRFVANAAHQLRTPIAGLKMQSELALRQKDPKDVHHALGLILTGAERAARLANQLLALARSEPGAVEPELWQTVDLNLIARDASRELVYQALSKNIDLGFEGSDLPALVKGDKGSLHELTSNLIENAILYTQAGGHVTVRIANSFAPTVIVEDNGPGIPAEERERVFERFYRLMNQGISGSGLGLSIVKEIASIHNADISVGEGPDGTGTSIAVKFPPSLAQKLPKELPKEVQRPDDAAHAGTAARSNR
jgi:two-component system sensor histidine kinase TctE